MQLEHSFPVPVPPEQAWRVLLDVQRIAPCMSGATLETVEGDAFTGKVKVRVGAIGLTYGGRARFVETDEAARRVVIEGSGRETRGSGTATATITATLAPDAQGTTVQVRTDLAVTGKPAQFGRGVMSDVAGKLIGQFAECLADQIRAGQQLGDGEGAAAGRPAPAPQAAEEIDLLQVAGGSVAKRVAYVAVPVLALALLAAVLRRLRG